MEIPFSDQNDAEVAAKREKLLARLNKRRTVNESQTSSKNNAKELDDLLQKATEDIEAKKVSPQIIEDLEKMLPSNTGRILKRIQDMLEELRKIELAQANPTKKNGFSFVRSEPPSSSAPDITPKQQNTTTTPSSLTPIVAENVFEISNKTNTTEIINAENGTSVALKDITNCILRFSFSPSAVHAKNIINCQLYFPEIESSILIYGIENCVIFATAQQIRVHDSVNLILHVSVKGAVILEGCKNISMAPYRLTRDGKPIVGSDNEQWKKPLDFDWLSSEPSPNWSLLPEKSWVTEELI